MDIKKAITVQQASQLAHIDEGYIRRMLGSDKFKEMKKDVDYVKIGKIWLINSTSWQNYIEKRGAKQ